MSEIIPFITSNWLLCLGLATVLGIMLGLELKTYLSNNHSLTPLQCVALLNHEHAVLVDLRQKDLYQKSGQIPNAIQSPFEQAEKQLKQFDKYKGKPLVFICQDGQNSLSLAQQLKKAGFSQVYYIKQGIAAWQSANLPLIRI